MCWRASSEAKRIYGVKGSVVVGGGRLEVGDSAEMELAIQHTEQEPPPTHPTFPYTRMTKQDLSPKPTKARYRQPVYK